MKTTLALSLLAFASAAHAGFTLNAGTTDPFAYQWFEPSWDTGTAPGFGNGTFNPGTGLVIAKDAVYQTSFWYRARRVGVQDMTRELQVTRYTTINKPAADTGFAEAYETSPASGMTSGLIFRFTTKLVAAAPGQSYVRVDWSVTNRVTEEGAIYEVDVFPYADLQTNPNSPGSDRLAYNAASRTFTFTNVSAGFPTVTFRDLTPEIVSFGAGSYVPFRSGLADNNVTYSLGSANPSPTLTQDWAAAFQTRVTLEPGATKTGAIAYGYNMTPPDSTLVSGQVTLENLTASPANRPVVLEFRDAATDDLAAQATVYLDANGSFTYPATLSGSYRVLAKASHWLRKDLGTITISGSAVGNVNGSLRNGDVDGDNVVSVFDYIRLSNSFDLDSSSFSFDAEADLDGDGVVSLFDYIYLSDNFDVSGD